MKYSIIVGFLATVLAVSAMPKGNSHALCVEFPKKWSDALRKCFQGVSLATYKSYMSRDTTTATRDAKCLALCIYTESGEFVDGRFDPIALEKSLREYVGSHPLLNQVVEMHVAAANAVDIVVTCDIGNYLEGFLEDFIMNEETEFTGIVGYFAHLLGASEPALRLLISILLGFPLAYLHRYTLYGKSPSQQHAFFIVSGVLLGIWNWGWDMLHSATALGTTYLILLVFGSSSLAVILTFTFNIIYLTYGYIMTSTEVYDIKWTMPHCVLTLRLIGLAWNYYDGNIDKNKLSDYQKNVALRKLPSLQEFAAFIYFPGSFLVGPQFSMKRYNDYVNGKLIESDPRESDGLPNSIGAGIKRTLLGFFYLIIYMYGNSYVSNEYMTSDDYGNLNFIKRLFIMGLWGRINLYKYISCWLLTEGVCTTFGLSYNGKDANGESKWDGCANVELFTFENATSFNHYIQSFNTNTNQWCAEYIYKRLKFLGSKIASQFFTLLFLAVWHGVHSGYYVTFFNEFIIMYLEKDIGPVLEKNEKLQTAINTPIGKIITWIILKLYTFVFMGYAFAPLGLLSYSRYMRVYSSVYYIGFCFFCIYPLLAPYVKRILRGSSSTRPHSE